MRSRRFLTRPVLVVLMVAIIGGYLTSPVTNAIVLLSAKLPTKRYRLPHHIPKYANGISLRLVMVHDVIHQRYPRHGRAWYEERNRITHLALEKEQQRIKNTGKPTEKYFSLLDDLGAGLEYLGWHQEAVDLMRQKLQAQQKQGLSGRALYTTYANLGTFLVHQQLKKGFKNKAETKTALQEGLSYIRKAIKVNPEAHFGRELWQAVILEFVIATLDNPQLLLKYDMIGNRLDDNPLDYFDRLSCVQWDREADFESGEAEPRNHENRRYITTVGAEPDWTKDVRSSHKDAVPFDEPTLGIVGMWRLGGGANPHFALALGEIMLRVGQRHIAWSAFERAVRMSERFHGDPKIVKSFVTHCRWRQTLIEAKLPSGEVNKFRLRFEKELAFGQRYQKAYHDFEAQQIRRGVSIRDPNFYKAFHAEHGPIASRSGEEEYFHVTDPGWWHVAAFLLAAGLCGMMTALFLWFCRVLG